MKCNHCGAEIPDDSMFCEFCGKKITGGEPASLKDKKKLALWMGIGVAVVIAAVFAIVLFGGGGDSALSAEEIFNDLNAEEHIKTIPNGTLVICENGDPEASGNILEMNLDNVSEVYVEQRNYMNVYVQQDGLFLSNGSIVEAIRWENFKPEELKKKAKDFLINPNNLSDLPAKKVKEIKFNEEGSAENYSVSQGIISFVFVSNERANEIRGMLLQAVYELRDELSYEKYGVSFRNLTEKYQSRAIREAIPLAIIEAMAPDPEGPTTTDSKKVTSVRPVEDDNEVFSVVENDPEFPGGEDALYNYLAQNVQYPQLARDNGITGKVYLTFVVEKDGRITNIKILRDIGGGCGDEAVRVVKSMPRWHPGKQRGKPVRVQFNLPVNFNLY